ncbi:MAG: hypothetical protein HC869_27265 [Rhodospirillales bacterium]|nr:hypothetical protein [Rhodospirillales bacterium]
MTARVAVVLARKGSVRLPRKNVMRLYGKPMVSWTFERAFGLVSRGLADYVAVSTDDDDVKAFAPQGTFIVDRPSQLATAAATSYDAMAHAIGELEAKIGAVRHITLLQPTSPLAGLDSTAKVAEKVDEGSFRSAISICAVGAIIPETGWRASLKSNGLRRLSAGPAVLRALAMTNTPLIWSQAPLMQSSETHFLPTKVSFYRRHTAVASRFLLGKPSTSTRPKISKLRCALRRKRTFGRGKTKVSTHCAAGIS